MGEAQTKGIGAFNAHQNGRCGPSCAYCEREAGAEEDYTPPEYGLGMLTVREAIEARPDLPPLLAVLGDNRPLAVALGLR